MRKKLLITFLIFLQLVSAFPTMSNTIQLPNIGTSALATLSIDQEIEMGDFYLRLLRANATLNQDPIINNYINQLGARLVAHADFVQTPFHFYVMQSQVFNAFAFFGGHVVIHSKLFLETDTESELASVMSHEIAHVTQRHLARAIESRKNSNPYVWGAALGSILLTLANPAVGIAALTSTVAGSQQQAISFTQNNEREADRIGLKTLTKAGFDPYASPNFLQKISDKARYSSTPPAMLLTHPLPDNRLTDTRNRANQLKAITVPSSQDYYLAKIRLALQANNTMFYDTLEKNYKETNSKHPLSALIYGDAFRHYLDNRYTKAAACLTPLLKREPDNIWFIDLMTDIDIAQHNFAAATQRLQSAINRNLGQKLLHLNLANVYIKSNELNKAGSLLHRYTHERNTDLNGWELLAALYSKQNLRGEEMSARAEINALKGNFSQAITLLSNAKTYLQNKPNSIARNDARIKQLTIVQKRYDNYAR